jgi:hypothetical protein
MAALGIVQMTALTRWYVTATHTIGAHGAELPYGTRHARGPGDPMTACGLRALDWPIFWDMPFSGRQEQACPACAQHLAPAAAWGVSGVA